MFAAEFGRRSDANGWGVTALSLHPGAILTTGLKSHVGGGTLMGMLSHPSLWEFTFAGPLPITKTIPQGAATSVAAALDSHPPQGGYYTDCAPVAMDGSYRWLSPWGHDAAAGARLWELTARLTAPGAKAEA